jgi:hypothetical protein
MLNDLDETIKQLLIRAGGGDFAPSQVDISFDIPNREWSTGIQRPTINCYLFDIHERRSLREEGWRVEGRGRGEPTRHKPLLFFDISYLITAWTRAIEDEHHLLWSALATLSRFPVLNDQAIYLDDDVLDNPFLPAAPVVAGRPRLVDCLQGALSTVFGRAEASPIYTSIAQLEGVLKSPGEFWTALENQLKPSLNYVVTLAMDRQAMRAGAPVTSRGLHFHIPESSAEQGFRVDQVFHPPAGVSIAGVTITVVDQGVSVQSDDQGVFYLRGLPPDRYLVSAVFNGQSSSQWVLLRDISTDGLSTFSDIVRDQDGQPLAGILVELVGTSLSAMTDAAGRFSFRVRPGKYVLRFVFNGWVQERSVVVQHSGHRLILRYGGS